MHPHGYTARSRPRFLESALGVGFDLECLCRFRWIQGKFLPPRRFVTVAVELAMVPAAQRYCELITDLTAKSAVLREPQMMRVARPTSADQAALLGNIAHVIAVADTSRLGVGTLGGGCGTCTQVRRRSNRGHTSGKAACVFPATTSTIAGTGRGSSSWSS
jgi:hypothetical protein